MTLKWTKKSPNGLGICLSIPPRKLCGAFWVHTHARCTAPIKYGLLEALQMINHPPRHTTWAFSLHLRSCQIDREATNWLPCLAHDSLAASRTTAQTPASSRQPTRYATPPPPTARRGPSSLAFQALLDELGLLEGRIRHSKIMTRRDFA